MKDVFIVIRQNVITRRTYIMAVFTNEEKAQNACERYQKYGNPENWKFYVQPEYVY